MTTGVAIGAFLTPNKVVGGGASGIMAAITAAGLGCSVKIYEKNFGKTMEICEKM